MRWATRTAAMLTLVFGSTATGWAQVDGARPATPTSWGDTGLWIVPTGEVLPGGEFSASLYRTDLDFRQGNTNVSFFPLTAAIGLGRAEIFGSMRVITRIDRDTVPLLFAEADNQAGGLVNDYPTVHETWTGNRLGDLFFGAKTNLTSQQYQWPLALALRGTLKLPTGDRDAGAGTGEYDGFVDAIGSGDVGGVEAAAFAGVALRGDPDDISISNSVRGGAGVGFPSRRPFRATVEVHGEWMMDDAVTAPAGLVVGDDGSVSPAASPLSDHLTTTVGLNWQHSSGVLLGAAVNYRFGLEADSAAGRGASDTGDAFGVEFRIGFHRGVKVFVPPPPAVALAPEPPAAAPAAPEPPAAVVNRPPAVPADCETCAVAPGDDARFENVLFDFDSYELRPDALPKLAPVLAALTADPGMDLEIEGHTCDIGTAEYNLALAERRAHAVHDYFVQRGVAPGRLSIVTYGEERPAHDNGQDGTRRLNRRAVLAVHAPHVDSSR